MGVIHDGYFCEQCGLYYSIYLRQLAKAYCKENAVENYFVLGPTPRDEDCACVGEENYEPRARKECRRFIALLRKKLGPEPEGARFEVKSFSHDFGLYYEAAICFDEDFPDSVEYVIQCEDNLPATWEA